MTTEYEKAVDAQEPVAWVAADTLNSPHPGCVSSLAYVSQLDKDRGREYVPLYAAPVAAQGEDDAWCAECGVKLENVRPGKHQHPICSQAAPIEAALEDAEKYRWALNNSCWIRGEHAAYVAIPVAPDADLSCVAMRDAAIDAALAQRGESSK